MQLVNKNSLTFYDFSSTSAEGTALPVAVSLTTTSGPMEEKRLTRPLLCIMQDKTTLTVQVRH